MRGRKQVHQLLNVAQHLLVDIAALYACVEQLSRLANVAEVVVVARLHNPVGPMHAIAVHDDIVGDAHDPGGEAPRSGISSLLQARNHLDESLLEDVVGLVVVTNHKQYISEQLCLIALQ